MTHRTGKTGRRPRGAYMATAGALALLMVGSVAARADVTDELLDQLKAKGVLTKAEYAKLKARHEAEVASHPVGPHGAPGSDRYVTALDKGVGVRIPGKTLVTKEGVTSIGDVDVKVTGALIFFGAEEFKNNPSGTAGPNGRFGVGPTAQFAPNFGVAGGLALGSQYNNSNSIRSGLLPSNVVLSLATNQMGWDIGFTAGAYFGGNSAFTGNALNANGGGSPVALGTPGIDLRQIFGTIGTPEYGTLKIGRDLGLFGGEAILNDFTLLGVGTPAGNAAPGNTALGRIGIGYVYADWIPQITYTTPGWNGFTASVAMMTPLDAIQGPFTGSFTQEGPAGFFSPATGFTSATLTAHDQPQFQGKLKYIGQFTPDAKVTAWVDGIYQQQRADFLVQPVSTGAISTFDPFTGGYNISSPGAHSQSVGVDGGVRLDWMGFSVVGYGYWGKGLGTTGLFWDGFSPNMQARKSSGWYAEAEYTFGQGFLGALPLLSDRFTIGGSFGQSFLEANSFDWTQSYSSYLVHTNESAIGFVRYKLTDWVAFQFEYINTRAINQTGGSLRNNSVVGGTTFFF